MKYITQPESDMHHLDRSKIRHNRMSSTVRRFVQAVRRDTLNTPDERGRWLLITLTYDPKLFDYQPHDLQTYFDRVRYIYKLKHRKPRYIWVMELHSDGRPHYHILLWLPKGLRLPKPDKSGMWKKGLSNVKSDVRHAAAYLSKYISKGLHTSEEFKLPKGARMFGRGGLSLRESLYLRWYNAPSWLRDLVPLGDYFRVVTKKTTVLDPYTGEIMKGGYHYPEKNLHYSSPYTIYYHAPTGQCYVKRTKPVRTTYVISHAI